MSLEERVESLERVVVESMDALLRMKGERITRAQLCARIGRSPRSLSTMIKSKRIPPPAPEGNWLLADILAWERCK